jgi:hypothetical protein
MLLLDNNTLEVYELDDACLRTSSVHKPTRITFAQFERLALKARTEGGLGQMVRLTPRNVVAVKLFNLTWAWGMRLSVVHNGELPIDEHEFGSEFVIVWPPARFIQAWCDMQEAVRRRGAALLTEDGSAVPPPSLSFRPHERAFGHRDVPIARRVDVRDLTVAQRLFAASMAGWGAPFPVRNPATDYWAAQMEQLDALEFRRFRQRRLNAANEPVPVAAVVVPAPAAARAKRGNATLDLPDEVVALIASHRLRAAMDSAASLQRAAFALMAVCRQFRGAAACTLQEVQTRVRDACCSLLGPSPMPTGNVQAVLRAAGLTVRTALALSGPWYEYVRARRAVERVRKDGEHNGRPPRPPVVL